MGYQSLSERCQDSQREADRGGVPISGCEYPVNRFHTHYPRLRGVEDPVLKALSETEARTVAKVAEIAKVNWHQAHRALQSLVRMLRARKGDGKPASYTMRPAVYEEDE